MTIIFKFFLLGVLIGYEVGEYWQNAALIDRTQFNIHSRRWTFIWPIYVLLSQRNCSEIIFSTSIKKSDLTALGNIAQEFAMKEGSHGSSFGYPQIRIGLNVNRTSYYIKSFLSMRAGIVLLSEENVTHRVNLKKQRLKTWALSHFDSVLCLIKHYSCAFISIFVSL